MGGPITVEHLKCCDFFPHKFKQVNFSKLTDSNKIYRIDFVSIHYHLCEISYLVIELNFFVKNELPITNYVLYGDLPTLAKNVRGVKILHLIIRAKILIKKN